MKKSKSIPIKVNKYNLPMFGCVEVNECTVIIPGILKSYDGKMYVPVAIESETFLEYQNLSTLMIPESIVHISRNAFPNTDIEIYIGQTNDIELPEYIDIDNMNTSSRSIDDCNINISECNIDDISPMFMNCQSIHDIIIPETIDKLPKEDKNDI